LGVLKLRPVNAVPLLDRRFVLFEMGGCENYCASQLNLRAYYLREMWRAELRRRRNPYNFRMTFQDLRCCHVFYICPRPVVLVSVEHEGAGNMFPMDLVGPTDSPWFSMALRLTSPAVKLIQQSGRMALAGTPFSYKAVAYKLGEHHRKTSIDWGALPFPTKPSMLFRLPTVEAALRVREVTVQESRRVGSHMLFITSVVSDTEVSGERDEQLFHAFGGHQCREASRCYAPAGASR
jgi:flavin reductase (DIM6/NTAB) family NADH-FMN oxidoreductase RutF